MALALLIHGSETPVSLSPDLTPRSLLLRSPPVGSGRLSPRGFQEITSFTGHRGERERERERERALLGVFHNGGLGRRPRTDSA